MVRRKFVLTAMVAIMVTIGILFVTYVSLCEPDIVWDKLSWNIEEGESIAYSIVSDGDYFDNNTGIIANITTLPQYSIIYTSESFTSSIVEISKVEVLFENGTGLGSYNYYFRMLLSKAILPCGEWELLDSLYVDPEDASFGPASRLRGYISKLESEYFLLGYVAVDFDSSSGWNAHISLETGLPSYIQYWKYDDFSNQTVTYPQMETRITLEMFLVS